MFFAGWGGLLDCVLDCVAVELLTLVADLGGLL